MAALAVGPAPQAVAAKEIPNVVVIFMDDMAYADIGPFGAKAYPTPHLDRMAKEGRKFTDFYVTQAVCSASRAGLLTGCYNVRVGIFGALGPKSNNGLHANEVTLAEICKQKGYATACYGKWHLGHLKKFLPMQHGFDDYFGLPYSNDMWPYHPGVLHLPMKERLKRWPHLPLIDKNEVINPQVSGKDQELLTTQYTERAVEFIEKNKDTPFFLYVPHSMVHVPLFVSDKFKGKSGAGLFGDVMMEVDWGVGQIRDTPQAQARQGHAGRLHLRQRPMAQLRRSCRFLRSVARGQGYDVRRWLPRKHADVVARHHPGRERLQHPGDDHRHSADGGRVDRGKLPDHKIDGKSIVNLVTGKNDKSPQEAYYFYYGQQLQAIRMGKWKLHFPHGYRTMAGRPGGTGGIPTKYSQAKIGLSLFNLEEDIGESTDVKAKHPKVVAKMQALGQAMRKELGDQGKKAAASARQAAWPSDNRL